MVTSVLAARRLLRSFLFHFPLEILFFCVCVGGGIGWGGLLYWMLLDGSGPGGGTDGDGGPGLHRQPELLFRSHLLLGTFSIIHAST